MYFAVVILLLLVLPAMSVATAAILSPHAVNTIDLIGKWYVFWAVGVRLLLAGVRQVIQPRFTAEEIFGIRDNGSLALVREVGFGNISMGVLGIVTGFHVAWVIPAAIAGGIYYGLAGLGHLPKKHKNAKETMAMVSDGVAFLVLLGCVIHGLFRV